MRNGDTGSGLARHLPYLRRHARALAGAQVGGDAFVRATLEAIAVDPDREALAQDARLYLFRAFHAQWTVHRATVGADPSIEDPLGGHLVGREALLLTAVEGMSVAEAAHVLGRDPDDVSDEIDAARNAIAEAIRSRVLIIEDEPIIMMHLEQIVEGMGHSIAATATTRDEAVREAARVAPDLVLADIHLADGSSGVEAAQDILDRFDVPVVFVTAYPERLLTGERPEPTYLVTKPFEPSTIIATVGQALLARQRGIVPV
jgi:CheY-like chemotaxis protein